MADDAELVMLQRQHDAAMADDALGDGFGRAADALAKELARTVSDAQAQLKQENELVHREFDAARAHMHREFSQLIGKADDELEELLRERASLHATHARQNDVVCLNVGGQVFTVKRETLCVCK